MKKVKALHVIPSISSRRGGPSKAVIELVHELKDFGVEGYVITTTDNGIYRELDSSENRWINYNNVPVMVFSCVNSRFRFVREYLISPRLLIWLFRNARDFDVIHFHAVFSFPTTIGMMVARYRKVPYIVRTIGQLNEWCLSQSRLKKKIMLSIVEKSNLEKAVCVHVTSEIERMDIIKAKIRNKTFMLGLGVSCVNDKYDAKDRNNEIHHQTNFLFLSRIHPKKRLDILIKSLSEVVAREWFLDIAGEGENKYVSSLKDYAETLGVADNICWHGHVTGITKEELIRRSDWFVLPSTNENFCIAAIEAMANGLPVIISSEVGIAPYVEKYSAGYVYSGSDEIGLRNSLAMGISCKVNTNMRANAISLVKDNFLWKVIAGQLSSYYRSSVIGSKG